MANTIEDISSEKISKTTKMKKQSESILNGANHPERKEEHAKKAFLDDEYETLFRALDFDNSGYISFSRLLELFKGVGIDLNDPRLFIPEGEKREEPPR